MLRKLAIWLATILGSRKLAAWLVSKGWLRRDEVPWFTGMVRDAVDAARNPSRPEPPREPEAGRRRVSPKAGVVRKKRNGDAVETEKKPDSPEGPPDSSPEDREDERRRLRKRGGGTFRKGRR